MAFDQLSIRDRAHFLAAWKPHPRAVVLFEGSTPARTRLYRMGINKWIDRVEADFEVLGFKNDVWEKYVKGGNYGVLLVQRKRDKFEHRF